MYRYISSSKIPNFFPTIKVFIHYRPLSVLSIISGAQGGGGGTHTEEWLCETHTRNDRSPCARLQSVGAPWSNLIKYN